MFYNYFRSYSRRLYLINEMYLRYWTGFNLIIPCSLLTGFLYAVDARTSTGPAQATAEQSLLFISCFRLLRPPRRRSGLLAIVNARY